MLRLREWMALACVVRTLSSSWRELLLQMLHVPWAHWWGLQAWLNQSRHHFGADCVRPRKRVYTGWSDITESKSRCDRHFVGITRYKCVELNGEDLSCYLNIIESVNLRKCSYEHWLNQQSVFKRNHSDKHFQEFLPTRWQQKSTGIDMEQKIRQCHPMYSIGAHWRHLTNTMEWSVRRWWCGLLLPLL